MDDAVITDADLADTYARAVAAAGLAAVDVEPEAQLTVPVAVLLEALAADHGVGALHLLREAQMPGVRPDFAALLGGRACGWVELKAPGHTLDGRKWVGREKKQWALLAELDALLVCNGQAAVLYRSGERIGSANLPYDGASGWDAEPLVDLLRLLATTRPAVIARASQLAVKLAPLARMLRDRVAAGLTTETPSAPVVSAKGAWSAHIHEHVTDAGFADDLAQVVAYSLAIAALRGGADANGDHVITLAEARASLASSNEVLAAALGPALTIPGLATALAAEVGAIERLVSAVDPVRVAASKDPRGEPWLWFYEDFLATYDPERRKQSGVYYTPTDVVALQVRLVDHVLREEFGRKLGYGDKDVVTLDPATGSGTYPLAVLDRAAEVARAERGAAGPAQIAPTLAKNLIAFEVLPGPYAVAHLRIGQRLAELAGQLLPPGHVRVYLTDTLDDPSSAPAVLGLWGDMAVLAAERERAAQVKSTQPVTVVLGNPPYNRGSSTSGGGWVVRPTSGRAIFDDITEPPKRAGVIFSVHRSLFDDYLYFWRWAIHKAFEQRPDGPAVVSFITASTWLHGPGFLGLRQLVREVADEVWVVDLGGDGRGANVDENVFAIRSPVAIVTLYRRGARRSSPAKVHYRRIEGRRVEKLTALVGVQPPVLDPSAWQQLPGAGGDQIVPVSGGLDWQVMPALADLFPWQQPGCIYARMWPIAPTPELLHERWTALLARTGSNERAEAYVTPTHGRSIHTHVAGLPSLAELPAGSSPRPVVRYGYRSFDRQWTFQDPRLAALERPSLWGSLSDRQVFLTSMTTNPLGSGPALAVATAVPDFHHFRGSFGGKDVIPLYRDAAAPRRVAACRARPRVGHRRPGRPGDDEAAQLRRRRGRAARRCRHGHRRAPAGVGLRGQRHAGAAALARLPHRQGHRPVRQPAVAAGPDPPDGVGGRVERRAARPHPCAHGDRRSGAGAVGPARRGGGRSAHQRGGAARAHRGRTPGARVVRDLPAVLTALSLLFAVLAVAYGVVMCVGIAVGNRWHVGSGMAPVADRLPRMDQWVVLPLIGYVLAIVCNVGTTLLTSRQPTGVGVGFGVLAIGAGMLMAVGSWFAVRRFPRDPWAYVGSWRALQAEVQGQQDSATAPAAEWLTRPRAKWRELEQERPGPQERRVERAVAQLPARLSPATVPARGLGVVRGDDGLRRRVPWRQVAVWSQREPWWWMIVVPAVTGTVLGVWAGVSAGLLTVLLVAALVLATVAARGSLILSARLHGEHEEVRRDVDDALRSWERQAPPPSAGAPTPLPDPVGRVDVAVHWQVSGCTCAPAWARLRLDDQHRAILSSEVLHAAGLPPGANLLARAEGQGRIVLESTETVLARLQDLVLDGGAAPVDAPPAAPRTPPAAPPVSAHPVGVGGGGDR